MHEGSGDTRHRQCFKCTKAVETHGTGSVLKHESSGDTRHMQCFKCTKAVETQCKGSVLNARRQWRRNTKAAFHLRRPNQAGPEATEQAAGKRHKLPAASAAHRLCPQSEVIRAMILEDGRHLMNWTMVRAHQSRQPQWRCGLGRRTSRRMRRRGCGRAREWAVS